MVVRIRLARHGRRNRAFYRIVAANSRSPRDGRFLEILGFYNPLAHSRQEVCLGARS
jgi:small subunit ribosomal protein S16